MLILDEIENAVRMQGCGYQLLKWLEDALKDGFNFFSTYLDCTFDLDPEPGQRWTSDCCYCCFCGWMVQNPHLRPKKVGTRHKKVAERMKRTFLLRLAEARGISVTNETLDAILQDPNLREPVGLCTYASDLLQRQKGIAVGAASLALWRSFAWTPKGSPKKDFVLTTDAIMMAQDLLAERLSKSQAGTS